MKPEIRDIYRVVAAIPEGRVATYGQVAHLAGLPRRARMVGRALKNTPSADDVAAEDAWIADIPWHRVINAQGRVSPRDAEPYEQFQRQMLEDEGVELSEGGKVSLARFRWDPEADADGVPFEPLDPEGGV
jgi:methylated-DNA-protein-cysteine methyltransferase-like protein